MFGLGLVALALAPASALADPTTAQYRSSLSQISTGGGDPPSATATATSDAAGDLPFTGLDVGLLAAVAIGLVVAGFILRRHAPSES